jgi:hypothetical protein
MAKRTNITHKTKDRVTRTSLKTGRVGSSMFWLLPVRQEA